MVMVMMEEEDEEEEGDGGVSEEGSAVKGVVFAPRVVNLGLRDGGLGGVGVGGWVFREVVRRGEWVVGSRRS